MPTQQITFRVPDMTCEHCVQTIRQAIESAIVGAHVEADLTHHLVTVTGAAEGQDIAAIITGQDYSFEPLEKSAIL